jgi:uncharacterized damage-inducible protein DinB
MADISLQLRYNAWANDKLCGLLSKIDNETVVRENKGSFNSIAKTLTHIWDAEVVWLSRLNGTSPTAFPSTGLQLHPDEIMSRLRSTDHAFIELALTKGKDFFDSVCSYKNLKGDSFADPVEHIIMHVVNHSTYHRGQIITMLREGGVTDVVSTDFILFLRTLK